MAVARATFTVVNLEEDDIPVPNTGAFTENNSDAQTTAGLTVAIAAVLLTMIGIFVTKRSVRK